MNFSNSANKRHFSYFSVEWEPLWRCHVTLPESDVRDVRNGRTLGVRTNKENTLLIKVVLVRLRLSLKSWCRDILTD